ncbi:MAG: hypothetical protein AAGJ84_13115 [Pseudomonadota bacterium]
MHTPRTQTPRTSIAPSQPLISETDEEPGGYNPPLIVRSTVEAPAQDSQSTGLLARRRKRAARRAGRHG